MPLSKARDAERKRQLRRLGVKSIMSSADVRAMRRAGLDPEQIESEAGKVASSVFYALLRDRDAIKAHLGWHHEATLTPDTGTLLEKLQTQIAEQAGRITMLEASFTLHEAQESYMVDKGR